MKALAYHFEPTHHFRDIELIFGIYLIFPPSFVRSYNHFLFLADLILALILYLLKWGMPHFCPLGLLLVRYLRWQKTIL